MKVLYLSPLIPSPSGTGGRRAAYNHLLELAKENLDVEVVAIDVEGVGERLDPIGSITKVHTFPRAFPLGNSIYGKLRALVQFLIDPLPRAAAVVAHEAACTFVKERLDRGVYDVVVIDHLSAWSILKYAKNNNIHKCYISHNIERDILSDAIKYHSGGFLQRLRLKWELKKTIKFESSALSHSSRTLVISSADAESAILRPFYDKTKLWPELPMRKNRTWNSSSGHLLFVGSCNYYPNAEAINWLISELMPKISILLPNLKLRIAGASDQNFRHLGIPSSVTFEGFVSDARLEELHLTASLFLSPVVLGSGVKIKVLEASSYGLPIAATLESLRGIDYLRDCSLLISRDPELAASSIVKFFNNMEKLKDCSRKSLQNLENERMNREKLSHILI